MPRSTDCDVYYLLVNLLSRVKDTFTWRWVLAGSRVRRPHRQFWTNAAGFHEITPAANNPSQEYMHFTVRWLAAQIPHRIPPCPPIDNVKPQNNDPAVGWSWKLPLIPPIQGVANYQVLEDPMTIEYRKLLRTWLDAELNLLLDAGTDVDVVIAELLAGLK